MKTEIHAAPLFAMPGGPPSPEDPKANPSSSANGPPPEGPNGNPSSSPDPPSGPNLPLQVALKAELHASALFAANGHPLPPPQPIAEVSKEEIPPPIVVQPPPDGPDGRIKR